MQDGLFDLGITGQDWIAETGADVEVLTGLSYAKSGTGHGTRVVLAVPGDHPANSAKEMPPGSRISTEFLHLTQRFFADLGIDVKVVWSYGATEAKVPEIVDAIVDITETGSTLRAHGMKILDTLMTSEPVLVANRDSAADADKRRAMDDVVTLLLGALRAEGRVLIKLNVGETDLTAVLEAVPAMKSPTVSSSRRAGTRSRPSSRNARSTRRSRSSRRAARRTSSSCPSRRSSRSPGTRTGTRGGDGLVARLGSARRGWAAARAREPERDPARAAAGPASVRAAAREPVPGGVGREAGGGAGFGSLTSRRLASIMAHLHRRPCPASVGAPPPARRCLPSPGTGHVPRGRMSTRSSPGCRHPDAACRPNPRPRRTRRRRACLRHGSGSESYPSARLMPTRYPGSAGAKPHLTWGYRRRARGRRPARAGAPRSRGWFGERLQCRTGKGGSDGTAARRTHGRGSCSRRASKTSSSGSP